VPIIRRNNCTYVTLGICYSVWMTIWYAPCTPNSHPHRVTNTKCRVDTVISPDDGHSRPKHVEKRNKHTKKNCAPSWLYLQDYTKMHGHQNIKNYPVSCFGSCLYWGNFYSRQRKSKSSSTDASFNPPQTFL